MPTCKSTFNQRLRPTAIYLALTALMSHAMAVSASDGALTDKTTGGDALSAREVFYRAYMKQNERSQRIATLSAPALASADNVTCRGPATGSANVLGCSATPFINCTPNTPGASAVSCIFGSTGASVYCQSDYYGGAYCLTTSSAQATVACNRIPSINPAANSNSEGDTYCDFTAVVSAATLGAVPASLVFSKTARFEQSGLNVTVKNLGLNAETLLSAVTALPFVVSANNCLTLAPSATCSIDVAFTPIGSGAFYGQLLLTGSAGSIVRIPLFGTTGLPTATAITTKSSVARFPEVVEVGRSSRPLKIEIANATDDAVPQYFALPAGLQLVGNNCPVSLAPRQSCALSVEFVPTRSGYWVDYIKITSDDGVAFSQIPVAGVARPAGDCK